MLILFTVSVQQGEIYPQKDGQYSPPLQGHPPQQAPPPYTPAQDGVVYNEQPGSYQQGTVVYTNAVVSDCWYCTVCLLWFSILLGA